MKKDFSFKGILFYLLVTAILAALLLPILWSILLSFKTNNEIVNTPLALPDTWNFGNYQRAVDTIDFGMMYFNTVFIVLIATPGCSWHRWEKGPCDCRHWVQLHQDSGGAFAPGSACRGRRAFGCDALLQ